jgi:hypothetical protein
VLPSLLLGQALPQKLMEFASALGIRNSLSAQTIHAIRAHFYLSRCTQFPEIMPRLYSNP